MSETEEFPPSKRMKVEPQCDETDQNQEEETNDNYINNNINLSRMVVNPIAKFENVEVDESQASTSQNNQVTLEELQKLREFQVLDEVNEDDSNDDDSDTGKSETELPDEEIEKMLDEDLPEDFKAPPKPKEKSYVTRQKIVLEEKGINHFEVLPLDWMMVRHWSGMPVYMHRGTRVCTLSKPYFLGKGNTRRHDIPISAIPCLAYRKALEEEEKQKEIDKSIAEQIKNGTWAENDQRAAQTENKESVPSEEQSAALSDTHPTAPSDTEPTESKPAALNDAHTTAPTDTQPTEPTDIQQNQLEGAGNDQDDDKKCVFAIGHEASLDTDATVEAESSENGTCPEKASDASETAGEAEAGGAQGARARAAGRRPVVLPGGVVMAPPRVETVSTSWKTQHLNPEQINDYCKNLFKFKTVNIMHFKRWADRRRYVKVRKTLQYPTLPEGTKLITIPAQNNGQENGGKATKRDWVMNMNGCSYLSVFHEYARRALQKQPVYEFKQLENAATPYQATVYIGGMQYGVGHGSSKRQAKSAAARASIHVLIPEMKDELDEHARRGPAPDADPDFSFFDYVGIEDPRIQEFCAATSEPSPHAILRTCLLRNFGAGDRHIHSEMKKLEYQKIELTMRVGKHSATVVCKNKKQAKQRASQSILQALHPHIRSWGSLLRLYGSRSVKSCKEKKLEEQQITLLQDKAQQNEPNYAVLDKLRNEMRKLRARDAALAPLGPVLVAGDLPTHSGSMLNNVDL